MSPFVIPLMICSLKLLNYKPVFSFKPISQDVK